MGRGGGEGVGDDGEAEVGGDFEGVVVEVEVADVGVVEALPAAAVVLDVVGVPALGEFFAVGGEFVDEVGEVGVGGGAGGFGAQAADRVVGDALPVAVEASGSGVAEDEAGQVGRPLVAIEGLLAQGAGESVGGEDVPSLIVPRRSMPRHDQGLAGKRCGIRG
ncbi:hypothetical protein GCM10011579_008860 [Streptomyces albiflavescens]|uniref:Uncharacterized protein n=1 Tax=Streptomyces albiflavescens TaxID=1623582 RepID=A0A917XU16_9ACTN|nr:hypothetical protein GCM10011579_008860 [Streptomyces albiflavescens]